MITWNFRRDAISISSYPVNYKSSRVLAVYQCVCDCICLIRNAFHPYYMDYRMSEYVYRLHSPQRIITLNKWVTVVAIKWCHYFHLHQVLNEPSTRMDPYSVPLESLNVTLASKWNGKITVVSMIIENAKWYVAIFIVTINIWKQKIAI